MADMMEEHPSYPGSGRDFFERAADFWSRFAERVEEAPKPAPTLPELVEASIAADNAWSAELVRVFGPAGRRRERYLPQGRGEEGSELRRLYDAKTAAWEAAEEAWRAFRAGQRAEG